MREARLQCNEGLHLISLQSPNVVLHGDRVVNIRVSINWEK